RNQQTHRKIGEREGQNEDSGHDDDGDRERHRLVIQNSKFRTANMADFVNMPSLPDAVREMLRDERAAWPEVDAQLATALEQHGIAPLLYAKLPHPALRHTAMSAAAAEPLRLEDLRGLLDAFARRGIGT